MDVSKIVTWNNRNVYGIKNTGDILLRILQKCHSNVHHMFSSIFLSTYFKQPSLIFISILRIKIKINVSFKIEFFPYASKSSILTTLLG